MHPKPPSAHVIALSEVHEPPHHDLPLLLPDPVSPLHDIRTKLQVCVGEAVITIGELMALHEQQVIVLNQAIQQSVDVLLEGKVIARGQLVAVDDQFAVRVTELPISLKT